MKENWTRICPRCKSREVKERGMISKIYSNDWVCLTCGWQGPTFPEIRKRYAEELPEQKKQFIRIEPLIIAEKMGNDNTDNKSQNKRSVEVVLILFLIIIFVIVIIIVGGRFLA